MSLKLYQHMNMLQLYSKNSKMSIVVIELLTKHQRDGIIGYDKIISSNNN